ncbi:DUF4350 domain-containing protein [Salibacter halophilus]|uniref:DUF4350 domain-containing protein n=1 Tax=Salibacter halophilus TaxID=1803916 RepID=A0A6N6M9B9_9FLAO|nr:DUF4350 domain-containing protein [Salibacter halophilus]KAB1065099.1 hypothetical protein F3059_03880 [Salibacter halophilus]
MKRDSRDTGLKVIITLVLLAVVGVFVLIALTSNFENWRYTFRKNGQNPYDFKLFYELVNTSSPTEPGGIKRPLTKCADSLDNVNYFFLGSRHFLDSANAEALISFVKRGNSAFICASTPSNSLFERLKEYGYNLNYYSNLHSETVRVRAEPYDSSYTFTYRFGDETNSRNWSYASDSLRKEGDQPVLGVISNNLYSDTEYINYYSVRVGDGKIFFHYEPLLFTNYFLKEKKGFEYVSDVLSQLPNKQIVWDNYHDQFHYRIDSEPSPYNTSPLKYILKQPSLKYAWYTLLAGVLLFLIFRSRREQRIIPISPKVENTSIELARSLGVLYMQSGSPKYIAVEMMKLFADHIRKKYRLTGNPAKDDFQEKLARLSGLDLTEIQQLYTLERKVVYNPNATKKDLSNLYYALQDFYKNAK